MTTDVHGDGAALEPRLDEAAPQHDLPVLEAYRAVAATLVMVTHVGFASGAALNGRWAGWLARMDFGVALFFLLSGFLLLRPWLRAAYAPPGAGRPVRVGAYLWRRAVRLVPAYLLVVAAVAVLLPVTRESAPVRWVETASFLHIYRDEPAIPGLTHTWSLATEVSFYLALPLIAVAALGPRPTGRPPRTARVLGVLAALVLVSLAWRLAWDHGDGFSVRLTWLPAYLDWFAVGMLLAWLREAVRAPRVRAALAGAAATPGACWAVGMALLWLASTPLAGPYDLRPPTAGESVVKHYLYAVAAAAFLLPAVLGPVRARWRAVALSAPLQWVGRISYGVFLWHLLVLELVRAALGHETFSGGFWLLLALTLPASLLAAAASWHLVELPAQRRLRHLVR